MQWKRMGWPILIDSLNLLEVTAVPLTFLIDEYGVIRYARPTDEDLASFLETSYTPSEPAAVSPPASSAEQLFLWGGDQELSEAIRQLESWVKKDPTDGWSLFRLGVASRQRYDSRERRPDDFQRAVAAWTRALAIDPNQYIWRRRIQQYGPRLDKPYPFYDWVPEARAAIEARGEIPVALLVEPRGAELAEPAKVFETSEAESAEPDPEGRIHRDERPLIRMETVVVPSRLSSGESARVHVVLRPDKALKAHWNNEVDELVLWVSPPEGWRVDRVLAVVVRENVGAIR